MRRGESSKDFVLKSCFGVLESPEGLWGALRAQLGLWLFNLKYFLLIPFVPCLAIVYIINNAQGTPRGGHGGKRANSVPHGVGRGE